MPTTRRGRPLCRPEMAGQAGPGRLAPLAGQAPKGQAKILDDRVLLLAALKCPALWKVPGTLKHPLKPPE